MYNAADGTQNRLVNLQPGTKFGPEIGFGDRLRDLRPGQAVALIKWAAGGTSLELDWSPGADSGDTGNWGPRFASFVNAVTNGIAALENVGWEPVIQGMCWQQGEQDAKDGFGDGVAESDHSADDYGANLSVFIARIREQFADHASSNGIRFVAGQVLPYAPVGGDVEARFPGRGLVRQAILDMDESSGAPLSVSNAAAIPVNDDEYLMHEQVVDGYSDNDEVHFSESAYL
ncbi:sialate O-acetylesterase, partial [Pontiellaceae bacterium B12227]|nr:sialate O-acetylesterase [Pontiellaceae bacterium B12227]